MRTPRRRFVSLAAGGGLEAESGRGQVCEQMAAIRPETGQQVQISRKVRGHGDEEQVSRKRAEPRLSKPLPPGPEQQQAHEVADSAGGGDDWSAPGIGAPLEAPAPGDDIAVADGGRVFVQELDGTQKRKRREMNPAVADATAPEGRPHTEAKAPDAYAQGQRRGGVTELVKEEGNPGGGEKDGRGLREHRQLAVEKEGGKPHGVRVHRNFPSVRDLRPTNLAGDRLLA